MDTFENQDDPANTNGSVPFAGEPSSDDTGTDEPVLDPICFETSGEQEPLSAAVKKKRERLVRATTLVGSVLSSLVATVCGLLVAWQWAHAEIALSGVLLFGHVALLVIAPGLAASLAARALRGRLGRLSAATALISAFGAACAGTYGASWSVQHPVAFVLVAASFVGAAASLGAAVMIVTTPLEGPARRIATSAAALLPLAAAVAVVAVSFLLAPTIKQLDAATGAPSAEPVDPMSVSIKVERRFDDADQADVTLEISGAGRIEEGFNVSGTGMQESAVWRQGSPVPMMATFPETGAVGKSTPWEALYLLGDGWHASTEGSSTTWHGQRSQERVEQLMVAQNADAEKFNALGPRDRYLVWQQLLAFVPYGSKADYTVVADGDTLSTISVAYHFDASSGQSAGTTTLTMSFSPQH